MEIKETPVESKQVVWLRINELKRGERSIVRWMR